MSFKSLHLKDILSRYINSYNISGSLLSSYKSIYPFGNILFLP
jgi:hypothetical protein